MAERIPEIIYLQWYGIDQREFRFEDMRNDYYERTWCQDRMFDTDVMYQRVTKTQKTPEKIVRAAIELPSGALCLAARHADCIGAAIRSGEVDRVTSDMQGFLTSEGRYVGRREAMDIAKTAKQLRYVPKRDYLMSEDLW